ncbi:glucose-6-phosphate isomerase family protein [Methanoregula sp.]|uniref:glucose-6-phosphate isomerase family protein n=1 Tax=Methanoregula sp. TaxID=2052170 RepID=UPI002D14CF7F|nr:glucose-6-phosphate isomerase family protein [Methanoregula sp.]HVP95610.1 glucose-6-phosphate isomerase family protein [Methanoregula sp.]
MSSWWNEALPAPGIRTVRDMRAVLARPECPESGPLYYMYRDLARSAGDRHWLAGHRLRYDITVIPPHDLCGEYVKTKGHYHPVDPAGTGYPELYEVTEGKAQFLLQSRTLDDVILISAENGARVVIPPGYGHITINPSPDATLILANIVSTAFESEYGEYETLHGAAYYVMNDGSIVKNRHYPAVPPVRHIFAGKGRDAAGRACTGSLYSLIGRRAALAFLNEPEQYPDTFTGLTGG